MVNPTIIIHFVRLVSCILHNGVALIVIPACTEAIAFYTKIVTAAYVGVEGQIQSLKSVVVHVLLVAVVIRVTLLKFWLRTSNWLPLLSNFDVPLYEEVLGSKEGQPVRCTMSVTPGLMGMKCGEGVRPKDSSKRMSAFQDYTSAMMSAVNNPLKPQNKRTATPNWTAVPPLVYLSASGTPVGDTQTKKKSDERYVPMNFSAVDKTVLTPQGRQEMKGVASPIKFTEALQNGDALRVNPQGGALMEALGFGPERVEEKDPDFYMPDGQGKKLSESYQMFTNEQTPEGNPGVIVKLSNLVKKYGASFI